MRVLSIEQMPNNPALLRFNLDGKSIWFDFSNVVQFAQTDTGISVNEVNRVLTYSAERHTDNISAGEIGKILHIADIGDVDIDKLQDNSLFVYRKNSNCGDGCQGINNSWTAWNSVENLNDYLDVVMGFDKIGRPKSLNAPTNTNQFYQLGWNAQNKVGFSQPVEVSTPPTDGDNKRYRVYLDPNTKQLVYVKENS